MSDPTALPGPPQVGRGPLIKAFTPTLTGTSLEYYDFAVYSSAAALVFPQLFFPAADPLTGTLLSFSTYAVGYLARPGKPHCSPPTARRTDRPRPHGHESTRDTGFTVAAG